MKIGFQGWFLTQGYTGIGQHCLGLLKELAKVKNLQVQVVVPSKVSTKGIPKSWIKVLPPPRWIPLRALRKWWWERFTVPNFFTKQDLDWEYYPYPCPLPMESEHLRAMTVHDTILWTDERYKGNWLKTTYHHHGRRSLVYVDQLFTVSETTHRELGIPAASVLGSGVPEIPKSLRRLSYQNALVYLGGYDIRKNVPLLVETFSAVNREYAKHTGGSLQLLLIGEAPHHSRYYPRVPEAAHLIRLGTLTDAEVYEALKSAFAFIHLSDSEGFNIPLLQALKVGVPAIVRDISVNREVSGGAALFLGKTTSRGSLKKDLFDMIRSLQNPKTRQDLTQAGKKAASRYSWKKSAHHLLSTLRRHGG